MLCAISIHVLLTYLLKIKYCNAGCHRINWAFCIYLHVSSFSRSVCISNVSERSGVGPFLAEAKKAWISECFAPACIYTNALILLPIMLYVLQLMINVVILLNIFCFISCLLRYFKCWIILTVISSACIHESSWAWGGSTPMVMILAQKLMVLIAWRIRCINSVVQSCLLQKWSKIIILLS